MDRSGERTGPRSRKECERVEGEDDCTQAKGGTWGSYASTACGASSSMGSLFDEAARGPFIVAENYLR